MLNRIQPKEGGSKNNKIEKYLIGLIICMLNYRILINKIDSFIILPIINWNIRFQRKFSCIRKDIVE